MAAADLRTGGTKTISVAARPHAQSSIDMDRETCALERLVKGKQGYGEKGSSSCSVP